MIAGSASAARGPRSALGVKRQAFRERRAAAAVQRPLAPELRNRTMLRSWIMTAKQGILAGALIAIIALVVAVLFATGVWGPSDDAPRLWTAGAMALGLSVGLTTGLSNKDGSGQEFVKFVSVGVVIPVLGAVGALLVKRDGVSERWTYDGTVLVEKITTTETSFSNDLLNPFSVLGLFFTGFAVFAVVGIVAGVLLRDGGFVVKAV